MLLSALFLKGRDELRKVLKYLSIVAKLDVDQVKAKWNNGVKWSEKHVLHKKFSRMSRATML